MKQGNAAALGTGPLALNGGVLDVNGNSRTFTGDFGGAVDSSAGNPIITLNFASPLTLSGTISNSGGTLTVYKWGAGALTLDKANPYNGGTIIEIPLGDNFTVMEPVTAATNQALGSGPVTIGRRTKGLVLLDGVTLTNSFSLENTAGFNNSGRGIIESSGTGNATVAGTISINGEKSSGGYFASVGGGTLTLAGPIVVNHALVNLFGIDAVRTGTVIFSGGGSYTNFGVTEGTARLGANNSIAPTAVVNLGTGGGAFNGYLDLAGFNQSLVGLTKGGNAAATATVTNSSATTDSTLTLTGTSTFAGSIVDGSVRKIALTVAGGTTTLTGTNAYSGNTTVSAGKLILANANLATNSTVSVAASAILQLNFTTTNVVDKLILGGVSQPNGVYNSGNAAPYLTGSGSLQVVGDAPTPVNIGYTVSGNQLVLTWPAGQGWQLQAQTNNLATGLNTNWQVISGATPPFTNNINPANPTVFYRLTAP